MGEKRSNGHVIMLRGLIVLINPSNARTTFKLRTGSSAITTFLPRYVRPRKKMIRSRLTQLQVRQQKSPQRLPPQRQRQTQIPLRRLPTRTRQIMNVVALRKKVRSATPTSSGPARLAYISIPSIILRSTLLLHLWPSRRFFMRKVNLAKHLAVPWQRLPLIFLRHRLEHAISEGRLCCVI